MRQTMVADLAHPDLSQDGLSLYGNFPHTQGGGIYAMRRDNVNASFDESSLEPVFKTQQAELWATVSPDELELYFTRNRDNGNVWVSKKSSTQEEFGVAELVSGGINEGNASAPDISADGLTLFFSSDRPGGEGSFDIWYVQRESLAEPWGEPVNAGPIVNSPDAEWAPDFAPDGRSIYFSRVGESLYPDYDLWSASIVPEPTGGALAWVFLGVCLAMAPWIRLRD